MNPEDPLNLERPLVFLDLEADGPGDPDPNNDRIVQLGMCIVRPGGWDEPVLVSKLVNPGMDNLPLRRSEIHGITSEAVVSEPGFRQLLTALLNYLHGADIATFNGSNYDIPLLDAEINRVLMWERVTKGRARFDFYDWTQHRHIDVAALWRKMEPRKLADAIDRFVGVRPAEKLHDAAVDSRATADVLRGMARHFAGACPESVEDLAKLTARTFTIKGKDLPCIDLAGTMVRDEDGSALYTAKRVRGVRLADDNGYAEWMLRNDFPEETKRLIRSELFGVECSRGSATNA